MLEEMTTDLQSISCRSDAQNVTLGTSELMEKRGG